MYRYMHMCFFIYTCISMYISNGNGSNLTHETIALYINTEHRGTRAPGSRAPWNGCAGQANTVERVRRAGKHRETGSPGRRAGGQANTVERRLAEYN